MLYLMISCVLLAHTHLAASSDYPDMPARIEMFKHVVHSRPRDQQLSLSIDDIPRAYIQVMRAMLYKKPVIKDNGERPATSFPNRNSEDLERSCAIRGLWNIDKVVALALYGIFAQPTVIQVYTDNVGNYHCLEYGPHYYECTFQPDTQTLQNLYYWPDTRLARSLPKVSFPRASNFLYAPLAEDTKLRVQNNLQEPIYIYQVTGGSPHRLQRIESLTQQDLDPSYPFLAPDQFFGPHNISVPEPSPRHPDKVPLYVPWPMTLEATLRDDMRSCEPEDLVNILQYAQTHYNYNTLGISQEDQELVKATLHNVIRYINSRAE